MMEKAQGVQGTTFVHADASNFMEVVQRLTGPHKEHHHSLPPPPPPPPMRSVNGNQGAITTPPTSPKFTGVRKPAFKLHERRQASRSSLMILKPDHTLLHALAPKVLSPPFRPLISPSKGLSQLVLCDKESSTTPESSCLNEAEEEKAIKERRFYLHPSPRSRDSEPELLPLFPLSNTPKSQWST